MLFSGLHWLSESSFTVPLVSVGGKRTTTPGNCKTSSCRFWFHLHWNIPWEHCDHPLTLFHFLCAFLPPSGLVILFFCHSAQLWPFRKHSPFPHLNCPIISKTSRLQFLLYRIVVIVLFVVIVVIVHHTDRETCSVYPPKLALTLHRLNIILERDGTNWIK